MLTWAQIAIGILHSGIAHERQPNFRHRKKKKEIRKIEGGEFITPPCPTGRRSNKTPAQAFTPPAEKKIGTKWTFTYIHATAQAGENIK